MLSEQLVKVCAPVLRFYRNTVLLDMPQILDRLPKEGRLLDVGCFIGMLTYEIARKRPDLEIVGLDIEPRFVALAQRYHSLPNIRYETRALQDITERFDCVLFSDVIHHVEPPNARSMLAHCERVLTPDGYILVKEVARRWGQVGWFMDRYISRSFPIYLRNPREFDELLPDHYQVAERASRFRVPFPNYYLIIKPNGVHQAAPQRELTMAPAGRR